MPQISTDCNWEVVLLSFGSIDSAAKAVIEPVYATIYQ